MNYLENIIQVGQIIFWIGLGLGTVLFVSGLGRVFLYEKKINKLYEERDREIMRVKGGMITMFKDTEMKIRDVREHYSLNIEKMQRKRRFILDKLPLIKK